MLLNNIKIALRSLLKQKVYTLINVLGLAVGIASCLVIVLFVRNEFSYDSFFKDSDRIYKMVLERKYPNHSTYYAIIPHSFPEVAVRDYPEVESSAILAGGFNNIVMSYKNERDEVKQFEENFIVGADTNFFQMFDLPLRKGDPKTVLKNPNDMVMSVTMAKRYFGDDEPVGKLVTTGFGEFKITGVFEDLPNNSHMKFDALVAVASFPFFKQENFTSFSVHCYFKLKPGTDAKALEAKFPQMVDTYASAQIERNLGKSWEDYKKEGNGYRYFLQPLSSIHLDPINIEAKMRPGGNITSVYIMISVAVLILLIACINFMNLATARSSERAKEVGVRKTMGSYKRQLVFQFLTESFLLSVVGVVLAVVIVQLVLPFFNSLTEKTLELSITGPTVSILFVLAAFVGFLAGIYPSFILSSFNPVTVLKGNFTGQGKGRWIRSGLVIFQFWISIVLMIGTMVIEQQMEFMRDKSLGFDKDQMLVVERVFALNAPNQTPLAKTYMDEVRRLPEVASAAGSFALPGRQGDFFGIMFQPEGSSEILTTKSMVITDELAEVLGLELLEGRSFSEATNDSLSLLLNEAAVKVMDIENPVGTRLIETQQAPDGSNVQITYTVVGIVKDFNFQSLRDEITPLVIQSNERFGGGMAYVLARVKGGQVNSAIQSLEAKWKQLAPDQPFKFTFLDEDINKNYIEDQKTGKLFAVFSGLAIFVACIGLFALSAYTASLRTKEIGIRKVLGASVAGVMLLLSKDFTRMVMVSFVLAVPIAWYVMETWWLQNFAYRINISLWIIVVAGAAAFFIAWFTVSFQSIRAAVRNPVSSLRSE